jgi:primosomal protein N' (replication factor Y)
MPHRIENRPLPDVATIDLRTDLDHRGPRNAISRPLHQAIRQTISDGNQAILLLNRRGFSTHIQCPACGHVMTCLECDIALTHHRDENKAMCHYCDYTIPAPEVCPQCSFAGLRYSGIGTQRLEAEVQTRFPEAASVRMDSDTMRRPNAHERALAKFRTGEAQILLGTQMIAKGLDFPNVTLVGVVNADTALHLPDFRAAERTFQLVTQVAGRTGRGEKGGRVLVQTFEPEHPAIQAAVRHDYRMFADRELPSRRQYGYPPYASMIRIIVRGPDARQAEDFAESARNALAAAIEREQFPARVVGPAPAPFAILRSKHRFHMLLIAEDGARLRQLVATFGNANPPPDDVEWVVDVDPLEML